MSSIKHAVYIVDDDSDLCGALRLLLSSVNLSPITFASAQEFLDNYDPTCPGCLILDVRMPGMSGLELQEQLRANHITIPIVIMTGHGDVQTTVRAMKSGAIDVIEKPFRDQTLLELVQKALQQERIRRQEQIKQQEIATRLALLTPRETDVMHGLMKGDPNKIIASELGVCTRTVEVHRASIMAKMQVRALSTLVQMVLFVRPDLFQSQAVFSDNRPHFT